MLAFCVPLAAQTFTGTVLGTPKDSTGAIIPGAKLSLTNINTNEQRNQESKEDGSFVFALIPPGQYRLEAAHEGLAIADAHVTVTNQAARVMREVTSSGSGYFRVPDPAPGLYCVELRMAGFENWA